ncbi:transcriptional regulator, TetR family [Nitrosospira multiformis ATCC 25196]|uniref:Transcriptional regulator, TetR family n=1 Tax=Nitrosospira multiformis (strain ATCC 25196 / NCIMB 11849 / C 71) TaxID=323848 RepID=Q2Y7P4_NITMU|nr:TetR/AcrR family transcriptional regulator [Nitrosospira multiformis]ABB75227.1 transcriptional regulator, TetR family [Nitrosospira multiformis ATCC 25196]SEF60062.1 transcriptional regulator, TetR family [Nitrosospira multiformis ATCC 25196]
MKEARKSIEEKLLLAARRLFCRAGIHATGVTRILEEAGVARASLYTHYGSKENLLKAVFDTEANMWFHWFDLDLPHLKCSPRERILALFDLLEKWFAKEDFFGCVFINAVAEHEKDSRWVKDIASAYRDQIIDRLRSLVVESGAKDPDMLTQKLGLIIEGAIVTAMVTQNSQPAYIARLAAEDILRCMEYTLSPAENSASSAAPASMEPV